MQLGAAKIGGRQWNNKDLRVIDLLLELAECYFILLNKQKQIRSSRPIMGYLVKAWQKSMPL